MLREPDLAPLRYREHPTLATRIATVVLVAAIIIMAILFVWNWMFINRVYAHDAMPTAAKPQGWSYPFSCCSGYDCREVGDATTPHAKIRIFERPEGYVISSTGEVVGYQDTRLKDSPDGQFHWCSVAGANNSRTICLYVPPRGM